MKVTNRQIVALVFPGFVSAVFTYFIVFNSIYLVVFLGVLGALSFAGFLKVKQEWLFGVFVFLFSFAFMFLWVHLGILKWVHEREVFDRYTNKESGWVVKLDAPVDKREGYSFLIFKFCEDKICARGKFKYYGFESSQYGDLLSAKLKIKTPKSFSDNFDYEGFLESKGISYTGQVLELRKLKEGAGFLRLLYSVKSKFSDILYERLGHKEAALASGILFGDKQGLPENLKNAFQKTGLTHIIVLSGYNISIIAVFVFWALGFLKRNLRALASIFFIGLFVLMVGADAPTLRAGVMGSLAFLAIVGRREADVLYLLFLAGSIMLVLSPLSVFFDPGFQMSFAVTGAIILYANRMDKKISEIWSSPKIRELFTVSFTAFLSVTPIIAYYMQSVSLVSLLANMLVLPVVPLAMIFSGLTILSDFLGGVSLIFSLPANILLNFIESVASVLGGLSFSAISFSVHAFVVFALYFAFMFYVSYVLYKEVEY